MLNHLLKGGKFWLVLVLVSVLLSTPVIPVKSQIASALELSDGEYSASELTEEVRAPSDEQQLAYEILTGDEQPALPTPVETLFEEVEKKAEEEAKKAAAKKKVVHTVKKGDSLAKIAKKYKVKNYLRLYYKNKQVKDPDNLKVGTKIVIPKSNERLANRELPAPEPVVAESPSIGSSSSANPSSSSSAASSSSRSSASSSSRSYSAPSSPSPAGSTAGNLYDYGYCTWYVKNRRSDLPNNLGNANTWYSRAAAQGYAVGSTPRVGAVGTHSRGAFGHVVIVEAVHGNGTITISEMNRVGWGVRSSRTTSASEFVYIY